MYEYIVANIKTNLNFIIRNDHLLIVVRRGNNVRTISAIRLYDRSSLQHENDNIYEIRTVDTIRYFFRRKNLMRTLTANIKFTPTILYSLLL